MKVKTLVINGALGGAGAAAGWYAAEALVLPMLKPANHSPMFSGAIFGGTASSDAGGNSQLSGFDAWDLVTLAFMGVGALLGIRLGHSVGI